MKHLLLLLGLLVFASVGRGNDPQTPAGGEVQVPLVFSGGHETDPRDHGRPVILIAAALNVPAQIFRDAFSHVHPAGPGGPPKEADVRQNKRALLEHLGPYGVTDDRLNEVSNYYRYRSWAGELWRHADAAGYAVVRGGKVVDIKITNPGAGYSTPPLVTVPGVALTVYPVAVLIRSTNLASNGSIAKIDLQPVGDVSGPAPGKIPPEAIKKALEDDPSKGPPPPPPPPPPPHD